VSGANTKSSASGMPAASPSSRAAAEESLRVEAGREPQSFEANYRLGKMLVDNGKSREALSYLERASQLNPGDYENAYELVLARSDAGQCDRARAEAQALLVGPNRTLPEQAELHHLLGNIEEKGGNPLDAVREYQRGAELNPSEPNLFDWGADLLLHRAFEPAIEVFTKGNRLFPRSARMLTGIGVAWYARGSYDQAARSLCEASDLDPNDPNPYLFLGKMQTVETMQSDCVVERLKRFVGLQPENALAHYYYALVLSRQDGSQDANNSAQVKLLLDEAVHLDPKLAPAYLQLGILYSQQGESAKAISAYQKAIEANPQLDEAHYRLAQAYNRAGEKLKAQAELQLYEQLSKKTVAESDRERREIQQFVYTLRDGTSVSQPQ
jgi:tetratricopeptide (TPR) repeat protein